MAVLMLLLVGLVPALPSASALVLPPPNDNFADAAALPFGTTASFDASAATVEPGEPHSGFTGGSVWWTYAPGTTKRVHLSFSCAYGTLFRVDGSGFAGLTDITPRDWPRALTFTAAAGTTYKFQCGANTGLSSVSARADVATIPSNDDLVNAAPLTLGVPTAAVDITGATVEPGEQNGTHAMEADAKSLWWTWTAQSDDLVIQNGFPAAVYAVTGTGFDGLTALADSAGAGVPFQVVAGTTYVFQARVLNYWPDYSQSPMVSLDLERVVPPANDDLADAVPATVGATRSADFMGATIESGEPILSTVWDSSGHPMKKSVWWTLPATAAQHVRVSCNCDAMAIYVVNGPGFGGLSAAPEQPPFPGKANVDLEIATVPGTTYAIQVGGPDIQNAVQSITLTLETPPANDDIAHATALPARLGDFTAQGSYIDGATIEPGEPNVGADSRLGGPYGLLPMIKSVWWTWTPTSDVFVQANGPFVYTRSGPGFAGLDEVPSPFPGGVTEFHASAGETYYLQMVAWMGSSGLFAPTMFALPPPPANDDYANAAPLPFGATRTVDMGGATVEPGEPGLVPPWGGSANTKSVWWTWSAPANVRIAGNIGCGGNANAYRVDGPGFAGLTPIEGDAAGAFTLDAVAGTTYAFQCSSNYGSTGSAGLQFQQLANHASTSSDGAAPGTITITSPQGTYVANVSVASLTPSELPSGIVSLSGALSYGITGLDPGSTIQVRIDLPPGSAPTAVYKSNGSDYTDASGLATIDGDSVSLTLTDGGAGDADGAANGTINDPVVVAKRAYAPGAPRITAGVPGNKTATLRWAAPQSTGGLAITNYVVTTYLGTRFVATKTIGAQRTATVTGLANGKSYTFRIAAKNAIGAGPRSPLSTPLIVGTPVAPTNVTATHASGGVSLTWKAPTITNGSKVIRYAVAAYANGKAQPARVFNTTSTVKRITGLTKGTYVFEVAATNARGTGPKSTPSQAIRVR